MALLIKIALYLQGLLVPQKTVLSGTVITAMTGNAAFPDPSPTLVVMKEKKDALEAKYAEYIATKSSLATLRQELKQLEYDHDVALTNLSTYAQTACGNDPAVLASAGIPLAAAPSPIGTLPAPSDLRAQPGQSQTIVLVWSRLHGAKTYIAQMAESANGPWTQIYLGTRARTLAMNLTPGTLYWFRTAAVGAAGQSDWSHPVSSRAS
jgi:hypothetical protein